jgi:hypothetical protein
MTALLSKSGVAQSGIAGDGAEMRTVLLGLFLLFLALVFGVLVMPDEDCPAGMRLSIGRGIPECVHTRATGR